jgi:hypothetical protein
MSDRRNSAEEIPPVDETAHASAQVSEPHAGGNSSDGEVIALSSGDSRLTDDVSRKSHTLEGMEMTGNIPPPATSQSKQRQSDHIFMSEGSEDADSEFVSASDGGPTSPRASVAGTQPSPHSDTTADLCPENGSSALDVRPNRSAVDPEPGPRATAPEGNIVSDGKKTLYMEKARVRRVLKCLGSVATMHRLF